MRHPDRFPAAVAIVLAIGVVLVAAAPHARERSSAGWLGVYVGDRVAASSDLGENGGVAVSGVLRNSPAEKAGLRARDRLLAVDGNPVASRSELASAIRDVAPGSWVSDTVRRGDREREIRGRLGERPRAGGGLSAREGWIGAEAIDLPASLRDHFGAPADAGVMISALEPGSPAEAAGVLLGDVVTAVDGEPIRSRRLLAERVRWGGVGNTLELTVRRRGAEKALTVTVTEAPPDDRG